MKKKILFLWDFHGVLEQKSYYAARDYANKALEYYGFKERYTAEDTRSRYHHSLYDLFSTFVDTDPETVQKLNDFFIDYQKENWDILQKYITQQNFAGEVLGSIVKNGGVNTMISNSSHEALTRFMKEVEVIEFFEKFSGIDGQISDGENQKRVTPVEAKVFAMQRYIDVYNPDHIVSVGDQETDIDAGKRCGATTYRFCSEEMFPELPETKADYLTRDLRDILREL